MKYIYIAILINTFVNADFITLPTYQISGENNRYGDYFIRASKLPKTNQVIDVVSKKDFTIKWSYKNNYAWWAEDLYVNKEGTKIIYIAKPTELNLYNPKPEKQPIVVIINEDQTKIVYRLEDIGGVKALKKYNYEGIRTASSPTHIWCKYIMYKNNGFIDVISVDEKIIAFSSNEKQVTIYND